MSNKQVKTQDLQQVLYELRTFFMTWDRERRKKVDIVLLALQTNNDTVDLGYTLEHIDWLAVQNPDYLELAPAAKKMLRIHYLNLSQSDEEQSDNLARMNRARDRLKDFEEKGML